MKHYIKKKFKKLIGNSVIGHGDEKKKRQKRLKSASNRIQANSKQIIKNFSQLQPPFTTEVLLSSSKLQSMDLLSEGPIEGFFNQAGERCDPLEGFYLNDTPVVQSAKTNTKTLNLEVDKVMGCYMNYRTGVLSLLEDYRNYLDSAFPDKVPIKLGFLQHTGTSTLESRIGLDPSAGSDGAQFITGEDNLGGVYSGEHAGGGFADGPFIIEKASTEFAIAEGNTQLGTKLGAFTMAINPWLGRRQGWRSTLNYYTPYGVDAAYLDNFVGSKRVSHYKAKIGTGNFRKSPGQAQTLGFLCERDEQYHLWATSGLAADGVGGNPSATHTVSQDGRLTNPNIFCGRGYRASPSYLHSFYGQESFLSGHVTTFSVVNYNYNKYTVDRPVKFRGSASYVGGLNKTGAVQTSYCNRATWMPLTHYITNYDVGTNFRNHYANPVIYAPSMFNSANHGTNSLFNSNTTHWPTKDYLESDPELDLFVEARPQFDWDSPTTLVGVVRGDPPMRTFKTFLPGSEEPEGLKEPIISGITGLVPSLPSENIPYQFNWDGGATGYFVFNASGNFSEKTGNGGVQIRLPLERYLYSENYGVGDIGKYFCTGVFRWRLASTEAEIVASGTGLGSDYTISSITSDRTIYTAPVVGGRGFATPLEFFGKGSLLTQIAFDNVGDFEGKGDIFIEDGGNTRFGQSINGIFYQSYYTRIIGFQPPIISVIDISGANIDPLPNENFEKNYSIEYSLGGEAFDTNAPVKFDYVLPEVTGFDGIEKDVFESVCIETDVGAGHTPPSISAFGGSASSFNYGYSFNSQDRPFFPWNVTGTKESHKHSVALTESKSSKFRGAFMWPVYLGPNCEAFRGGSAQGTTDASIDRAFNNGELIYADGSIDKVLVTQDVNVILAANRLAEAKQFNYDLFSGTPSGTIQYVHVANPSASLPTGEMVNKNLQIRVTSREPELFNYNNASISTSLGTDRMDDIWDGDVNSLTNDSEYTEPLTKRSVTEFKVQKDLFGPTHTPRTGLSGISLQLEKNNDAKFSGVFHAPIMHNYDHISTTALGFNQANFRWPTYWGMTQVATGIEGLSGYIEGSQMTLFGTSGYATSSADYGVTGGNADMNTTARIVDYGGWDTDPALDSDEVNHTHVIHRREVDGVIVNFAIHALGSQQAFEDDGLSPTVETDRLSINLEVEVGFQDIGTDVFTPVRKRFTYEGRVDAEYRVDSEEVTLPKYSEIIDSFPGESIGAVSNKHKRYATIRKLDYETLSVRVRREVEVHAVTEVINQAFTYPGSALAKINVDARQFQNVPKRTYNVRLKKVLIPSNYYPLDANGKDKRFLERASDLGQKVIYDGSWNGAFKLGWTDNPAWILYDLLINNRYGLGSRLDDIEDIDIFNLYKIGRYCDAVDENGFFVGIEDGVGGLEPRFSCNILFNDSINAFEMLQEIASVFNGKAFWSNGSIDFYSDRPTMTSAYFNNGNVFDGVFNYEDTSDASHFNVVEVVFQDKSDNFIRKVETVEDEEGIRKNGKLVRKITGRGTTSRGQARRLAKYVLYSNKLEREIISFQAGTESLMLNVGDIMEINDELRSFAIDYAKVVKTEFVTGDDTRGAFARGSNAVATVNGAVGFVGRGDKGAGVKTAVAGIELQRLAANNEVVYVSFNATLGSATPTISLRKNTLGGALASDAPSAGEPSIVNGSNSFELVSDVTNAQFVSFHDSTQNEFTISNFKASLQPLRERHYIHIENTLNSGSIITSPTVTGFTTGNEVPFGIYLPVTGYFNQTPTSKDDLYTHVRTGGLITELRLDSEFSNEAVDSEVFKSSNANALRSAGNKSLFDHNRTEIFKFPIKSVGTGLPVGMDIEGKTVRRISNGFDSDDDGLHMNVAFDKMTVATKDVTQIELNPYTGGRYFRISGYAGGNTGTLEERHVTEKRNNKRNIALTELRYFDDDGTKYPTSNLDANSSGVTVFQGYSHNDYPGWKAFDGLMGAVDMWWTIGIPADESEFNWLQLDLGEGKYITGFQVSVSKLYHQVLGMKVLASDSSGFDEGTYSVMGAINFGEESAINDLNNQFISVMTGNERIAYDAVLGGNAFGPLGIEPPILSDIVRDTVPTPPTKTNGSDTTRAVESKITTLGVGSTPQLALFNTHGGTTTSTTYLDHAEGVVEFTYFVPTQNPIVGNYWHIGATNGPLAGDTSTINLRDIYSDRGHQIVGGAWTTATLRYGEQFGGKDKPIGSARFLTVLDSELLSDSTDNVNATQVGQRHYISEYKLMSSGDVTASTIKLEIEMHPTSRNPKHLIENVPTGAFANIDLENKTKEQYRVLSIKPSENNLYDIVGTEYNSGKFEFIDKSDENFEVSDTTGFNIGIPAHTIKTITEPTSFTHSEEHTSHGTFNLNFVINGDINGNETKYLLSVVFPNGVRKDLKVSKGDSDGSKFVTTESIRGLMTYGTYNVFVKSIE